MATGPSDRDSDARNAVRADGSFGLMAIANPPNNRFASPMNLAVPTLPSRSAGCRGIVETWTVPRLRFVALTNAAAGRARTSLVA
jgi:hypothetical protein